MKLRAKVTLKSGREAEVIQKRGDSLKIKYRDEVSGEKVIRWVGLGEVDSVKTVRR